MLHSENIQTQFKFLPTVLLKRYSRIYTLLSQRARMLYQTLAHLIINKATIKRSRLFPTLLLAIISFICIKNADVCPCSVPIVLTIKSRSSFISERSRSTYAPPVKSTKLFLSSTEIQNFSVPNSL